MDKYILLLALETLREQVVDAMKDKKTTSGIEISKQHLVRIKEQINIIRSTLK